jgi:hypothetical protein
MRYSPFLASASVLVLSVISTTFVLLTLTSKRWAVQNYYFSGVIGGEGDGSMNIDPLTWAYRSPFYRCGVPEIYENKTGIVPFCQFYKPYGRNATSCRTSGEMKLPSNQVLQSQGLLGTAQECQQGEGNRPTLHGSTDASISSLRRKSPDRGIGLPDFCLALEFDSMPPVSNTASQNLYRSIHNPHSEARYHYRSPSPP